MKVSDYISFILLVVSVVSLFYANKQNKNNLATSRRNDYLDSYNKLINNRTAFFDSFKTTDGRDSIILNIMKDLNSLKNHADLMLDKEISNLIKEIVENFGKYKAANNALNSDANEYKRIIELHPNSLNDCELFLTDEVLLQKYQKFTKLI